MVNYKNWLKDYETESMVQNQELRISYMKALLSFKNVAQENFMKQISSNLNFSHCSLATTIFSRKRFENLHVNNKHKKFSPQFNVRMFRGHNIPLENFS